MTLKSGLPLGELLLVGFEGLSLPDSTERLIRDYSLGGILYFARNIESPTQLKAMSDRARTLAEVRPFWIGVDQEGGRVRRLRPPHFSEIPTGRAMGELFKKNPAALDTVIAVMAREMREVGITLDFAPVLDVHTNPDNPIIGDRAFSSDPDEVAAVAQRFIDGFHAAGILACGKHFPGHGDTDLDSHLDLPVVSHPIERLEAVEWLPFRRAIAGGLKMVMTAHVLFPEIDPTWPATLSPTLLQTVLRRNLGFDGVIITDDMAMKGISKHWDLFEASMLALQAGADVILVCEDFTRQEALLHHLDRAVVDGILPKAQIENSLQRIRRVKTISA